MPGKGDVMLKATIPPADGLQRRLDGAGRRVDRAARLWARESGETVKAAALALLEDGEVPENDSGALAASLKLEEIAGGNTISSAAPHAFFAEFGTRARPSPGWLGRAFAAALPQLKRLGVSMIKQAVRDNDRRKNEAAR